jgi:hypothetical protein
MCRHFGEHHDGTHQQLEQIHQTHEAPDDLVEECCLPDNESLHLVVTPISGCDGFEPAAR